VSSLDAVSKTHNDDGNDAGVWRLRIVCFFLASCLPFALAWSLTPRLIELALRNDTFSQVPLVPLVSLFLCYSSREKIFSKVCWGWGLGSALVASGLICLGLARLNLWQITLTNQLSLLVLGIVLFWIGMFALLFGARALRVAFFPLCFLIFAIPIPEPLLSSLVLYLQKGSAAVAQMFFRILGVPNLRQGLDFELPGVRIRVAEECSGIRSTLALLITTVLACHLFLRSPWKRFILCAVVVPIAIIKNGLRIAALSALAIYVDPGFLYGNLHHYGGIVFFIFALLPMALLLIVFQKRELRALRVQNA
jgi:exosortase